MSWEDKFDKIDFTVEYNEFDSVVDMDKIKTHIKSLLKKQREICAMYINGIGLQGDDFTNAVGECINAPEPE